MTKDDIKSIEYNNDLAGFILTLQDDRTVQVQYCDRFVAAGDYRPEIDTDNDYGLDLNDDEYKFINQFIATDKKIMAQAKEFNKEYALYGAQRATLIANDNADPGRYYPGMSYFHKDDFEKIIKGK